MPSSTFELGERSGTVETPGLAGRQQRGGGRGGLRRSPGAMPVGRTPVLGVTGCCEHDCRAIAHLDGEEAPVVGPRIHVQARSGARQWSGENPYHLRPVDLRQQQCSALVVVRPWCHAQPTLDTGGSRRATRRDRQDHPSRRGLPGRRRTRRRRRRGTGRPVRTRSTVRRATASRRQHDQQRRGEQNGRSEPVQAGAAHAGDGTPLRGRGGAPPRLLVVADTATNHSGRQLDMTHSQSWLLPEIIQRPQLRGRHPSQLVRAAGRNVRRAAPGRRRPPSGAQRPIWRPPARTSSASRPPPRAG